MKLCTFIFTIVTLNLSIRYRYLLEMASKLITFFERIAFDSFSFALASCEACLTFIFRLPNSSTLMQGGTTSPLVILYIVGEALTRNASPNSPYLSPLAVLQPHKTPWQSIVSRLAWKLELILRINEEELRYVIERDTGAIYSHHRTHLWPIQPDYDLEILWSLFSFLFFSYPPPFFFFFPFLSFFSCAYVFWITLILV